MNAATANAARLGTPGYPPTRKVYINTPWGWLITGMHDVRAAPVISILYGGFFAGAGAIITYLAWTKEVYYLTFPLMAGFLLIAPIAAVGLYETSRRLDAGEQPSLWAALTAFRKNPTQIALLGVLLLVINFAWVRLAALVFMASFSQDSPPVDPWGFIGHILRPENIGFLVIGNLLGAVLAAITFAVSVVSIPLLLDRPEASVVDAITTSWRAARHNPGPMALWAWLIAMLMAIGFLTAFIGMVVVLPLVGYASWAAYKNVVIWSAE